MQTCDSAPHTSISPRVLSRTPKRAEIDCAPGFHQHDVFGSALRIGGELRSFLDLQLHRGPAAKRPESDGRTASCLSTFTSISGELPATATSASFR